MKTIVQSEKEAKKEMINLLHNYRLLQKKFKIAGYIPQTWQEITPEIREELKFSNTVREALNLLPDEERLLLTYRYLENNGETFDYIVCNKLAVSERTYYRIKSSALLNLSELIKSQNI